MIKLLVKQIDGFNYYLCDVDSKNSYIINIEFYSVKPEVGDYLYLSHPLVKENILNIGPLTSKYGKEITEEDDDLIKLEHDGNIIYLKRLYG